MLGLRFMVTHNLYFYNKLMEDIRNAIDNDKFEDFKNLKLEQWGK
jgi:queuine tRNA-ribosyltransferase